MSHITYHMSPVTCHVSHVTCHMLLMPTATATDPPRANSPTVLSRVVGKYPKKKNFEKRKKS